MSAGLVDLILVIVANLYNLVMVIIFLARAKGLERVERRLGLFAVSLALPLAGGILYNYLTGRDFWLVFLPLILALYLGVELLLDYILRLDFRYTALLGPYLLLYYLALFGMIGYAFLAGRFYGFVTLLTYFLNLFATFYSYRRVGHGPHAQR